MSKNWLTYALGVDFANEQSSVNVNGAIVSVGYKRVVWKDKLSSNLNLVVGNSWSGLKGIERDKANFDACVNFTVDYDLVGYKNVFLNIETGPFVGMRRTLKGTGTEFDSSMSIDVMHPVSEIENSIGYGGVFLASVKILSPNKKLAFRICPIGIRLGNNMSNVYGLIGLNVRL